MSSLIARRLQGSQRAFYSANRPGAKVSQGLRDSFWLQGMQTGFTGGIDCIKYLFFTDTPTRAAMAQDIHAPVRSLGQQRIGIVGHDIGLMVAYAYAAQYPNEAGC